MVVLDWTPECWKPRSLHVREKPHHPGSSERRPYLGIKDAKLSLVGDGLLSSMFS